MKNDALGTPGVLPNGQRLRQEIVKAVSYIEVQKDLTPLLFPTQGATLKAFLEETLAYMATKELVEPEAP